MTLAAAYDRQHRNAVALWFGIWALLAVACGGTSGRTDLLHEVLRERAAHLGGRQRGVIARELARNERKTGVDALLLMAVIEQESQYRKRARGPRGALGLMQLRPATAREVARRHGVRPPDDRDLFDPSVNLLLGARHLAELHKKFGSWDLALTAYNRGPTGARKLRSQGKSPSSRYSGGVLKRFASIGRAASTIGE